MDMQDIPNIAHHPDPLGEGRRMLSSMAELIRYSRGIDNRRNLEKLLSLAVDTVGGDVATYSLLDLEKGAKIAQKAVGHPNDFCSEVPLAGSICYEEFIGAGKMYTVIQDLRHTMYATSDPDVKRNGFCSYVGVAVYKAGKVIGSLAVYAVERHGFDKAHADALQIIAQAVAFVIAQEKSAKSYLRQQLDENQRLISQIFQLSPTCIYQIDLRAGRLLKVNEQMCRLTGYSEAELLSMKAEELLTEQSQALFSQTLIDIESGKAPPETLEFQVKTKSGDLEWGLLHIHHLFEDGKVWGANVVALMITEQKRAAEELAAYRRELETLVEERTRELVLTNQKLREEVVRRTETAKELRLKTERLKELNTAMRVLLDKRNEDRLRSEENIRVNLVQLIEPYLDRLDNSELSSEQRQLLDVIRMNLVEVAGSPMPELSAKYYIFSPTELQVANLIRNGKTTKDMARILNISPRTVESYRNSIRNKLGLKNKKVNLKTYLSAKE